jgi:hypothetical protein
MKLGPGMMKIVILGLVLLKAGIDICLIVVIGAYRNVR